MNLIIKNKVIEAPIPDIIETLRTETGNKYFNFIGKPNKEHLQVQCCFHKNGQEMKPSASFYNDTENDEVEYGFFKCFTCGKKAPLYKVVNHCFNKPENAEFGKDWLVDNFGSIIPLDLQFPKFKEKKKPVKIILDESVLNDYNFVHPYMYKRKLKDEIIAKFKIGYDPESDSITFPCWDVAGNLVSVNKRSVKGKAFRLVQDVEKPVYLLNYAINENATCVYVMESQINALSFMSYFPNTHAVALMGTGSKEQYKILKKSGIRSFILMFDGDPAGFSGAKRFIENLGDSSIITNIKMPIGKDVNDLSKEELIEILKDNNITIN